MTTLTKAHATFCDLVAQRGDDVSPMVIVLKGDEVLPIVVPGDGDAIAGVLHMLAFDGEQMRALGCTGLIVHAVAWSTPPEVAAEYDSIAITMIGQVVGAMPMLHGLKTPYDPATKVLGETATVGGDTAGAIGSALAAATMVCVVP